MFKKGFTLTEILITIGIIGVVATLTIPNVIKNIERKDLEAAFKKSYTVISQAVAQMKVQEGAVWTYYNYKDNNGKPGWSTKLFYTDLKKYINVTTLCCSDSSCPITCDPANATYYKNFPNQANFGSTGLFINKFYTTDGMLISPTPYSNADGRTAIWVDTNGYKKGPNRAGYDLFLFQVMEDDKVLPMGAPNTSYTLCSNTTSLTNTGNGNACANRAAYEKDYFKNLP